ncbi:MAG: hypothetical protein NUV69_02045 [Candidatus Curtissbacteria bacterium]|nr:hypothetical protein [Candidatus Curtissbacteria bacterium]
MKENLSFNKVLAVGSVCGLGATVVTAGIVERMSDGEGMNILPTVLVAWGSLAVTWVFASAAEKRENDDIFRRVDKHLEEARREQLLRNL